MKIHFPDMFLAVSKITGTVIQCTKSPTRHTTLALKSALRNSIWVEDHEALYRVLEREGKLAIMDNYQAVHTLRALFFATDTTRVSGDPRLPILDALSKEWKDELITYKGLTPWNEISSIQFYKVTEEGIFEVDDKGTRLYLEI